MKTLPNLILLVLTLISLSCNSQSSKQPTVSGSASDNSDKIEAYYFHFTARCVTCKTIEADTKKNLESLYPEQIRTGLIAFQSLNLDEEPSRVIAKQLGVSGQTLLLVKGNQKINLTNEGFMYAVPKPEKFKEIINEKVECLLTAK
ncbi:MAG TPA: nitrophenyl compound nitroreductase subunit ArsF family protein [Bacteroidales bacterium]|nr:nitrophenyl compound nitroreductase subunit ArsF family protein [Bacteroidales bacterium]